MPTKPKRPCRYGGCPNLTDSRTGYCEEHRGLMQRHYEHFARGYNQHERYGSGWRKVRDRYISAHPLCEECLGLGKATVITDKPNKTGGDRITGTERKADGTVKYMSAVEKHTGRKVKPFGVRTNVWHYGMGFMKSTTDRIAYKNPAIFPEKLAHDHIISWSNPGDVVLDPFMGSGTVAKMARLAGRDYIGFEISPEYCAIAEERLKNTASENL